MLMKVMKEDLSKWRDISSFWIERLKTRQMSRQVSRGSAGEYQADEQAGVARLRWRVSGR